MSKLLDTDCKVGALFCFTYVNYLFASPGFYPVLFVTIPVTLLYCVTLFLSITERCPLLEDIIVGYRKRYYNIGYRVALTFITAILCVVLCVTFVQQATYKGNTDFASDISRVMGEDNPMWIKLSPLVTNDIKSHLHEVLQAMNEVKSCIAGLREGDVTVEEAKAYTASKTEWVDGLDDKLNHDKNMVICLILCFIIFKVCLTDLRRCYKHLSHVVINDH